MQQFSALQNLRECIQAWKAQGLNIAFVPTMGNLHAGHYSLIALARAHADKVVASVFVNPTQFGPNEDFSRYPRTPVADAEGLQAAGCDALWLPDVDTMYPLGVAQSVQIRVPGLTDILEGAHRPGHFDGVCTVVARLFNQVQPDSAVFGRKDYQQLAVIRHMVQDLSFPIALIAAAICRENDGLAMSSRNQYLDAAQRKQAPEIYRVLQQMRQQAEQGAAVAKIEQEAMDALRDAGFVPDYAVLRTPQLLPNTAPDSPQRVALIAAKLGQTRLIDNLEFSLDAQD